MNKKILKLRNIDNDYYNQIAQLFNDKVLKILFQLFTS